MHPAMGYSPLVENSQHYVYAHPPQYMDSTPSTSQQPLKKKQGRGPGRKDHKDRPTVSVRWDDGDLNLTERLIAALENNDRWASVLAPQAASSDHSQPRVSIGVPKRDLQRELARHLFSTERFNLDDKKVLEALAVSVKNKLFKITTLYTECKQELGYVSTLADEREIPQGEHAVTWARVKEKFPQFFRIRDLMNRLPAPGTPRQQGDEPSTPTAAELSSTRLRSDTTSTAPIPSTAPSLSAPMNSQSSSLRGAVDLPKEASSYAMEHGGTFMAAGAANSATISSSSGASPSYPHHSPQLSTSASAYPHPQAPSRRPQQSSNLNLNPSGSGQSRHPTMVNSSSTSNAAIHPQTGMYQPTPIPATQHHRPGPYTRPPIQIPINSTDDSAYQHYTANPASSHAHPPQPAVSHHSPSPPTPSSPPLSATIQSIVNQLAEKKDREQQRVHELEMMRMKRDEAERIRWHQREMLRLRIQLIRAERGQATTASTGAGPSVPRRDSVAGPVVTGVATEDDLGVAGITGATGIPDDLSMEGDGEGELDEDMLDQEPPPIIPTPATSAPQAHVSSAVRMQGPASSSRTIQQTPHR
ncbi:hypothetical protein FRC03_008097 [Tulasnella sp. 419]|nr:hypothetical protein FRC02_004011 [Tulasnella sp. 418]KAG8959337.1 hypothetical protein FRC03_008097 [Tulasnella sp. 419]